MNQHRNPLKIDTLTLQCHESMLHLPLFPIYLHKLPLNSSNLLCFINSIFFTIFLVAHPSIFFWFLLHGKPNFTKNDRRINTDRTATVQDLYELEERINYENLKTQFNNVKNDLNDIKQNQKEILKSLNVISNNE